MSEDQEKGLVIVYTGDGKGKTTAALGMCVRAVGYGMKAAVIQFIKGTWKYGELDGIKRLEPEVEFHRIGKGFVGIVDDETPIEEHRAEARKALAFAREKIASGDYEIVILDEINIAVKLGLIDIEQVLQVLRSKPEQVSVVLTGRNAHEDLVAIADLVTEMREIKHPYQKGIPAKRGIDY